MVTGTILLLSFGYGHNIVAYGKHKLNGHFFNLEYNLIDMILGYLRVDLKLAET